MPSIRKKPFPPKVLNPCVNAVTPIACYDEENDAGREPGKCLVLIHQRLLSWTGVELQARAETMNKCQKIDSDTTRVPLLSVVRRIRVVSLIPLLRLARQLLLLGRASAIEAVWVVTLVARVGHSWILRRGAPADGKRREVRAGRAAGFAARGVAGVCGARFT